MSWRGWGGSFSGWGAGPSSPWGDSWGTSWAAGAADAGERPPLALTQPRPFGTFTGRRYGAFSRASTGRPPLALTQPRAFGAFTGSRYGGFSGRASASGRSNGLLTQWRAYGTGRRYATFIDRVPGVVTPPPPPPQDSGFGFVPMVPRPGAIDLKLDDEDLLAMLPLIIQVISRRH